MGRKRRGSGGAGGGYEEGVGGGAGGRSEGGGGFKKSKRHKAKYLPQGKGGGPWSSGAGVPPGSRGFLVSCVTGKEHACSREIIRLLTEFKERLERTGGDQAPVPSEQQQQQQQQAWQGSNNTAHLKDVSQPPGEGPTGAAAASAGEEKAGHSGGQAAKQGGGGGFRDIEKILQGEVEDLKSKAQNPFEHVDCGCKSLLFIRMRAPDEEGSGRDRPPVEGVGGAGDGKQEEGPDGEDGAEGGGQEGEEEEEDIAKGTSGPSGAEEEEKEEEKQAGGEQSLGQPREQEVKPSERYGTGKKEESLDKVNGSSTGTTAAAPAEEGEGKSPGHGRGFSGQQEAGVGPTPTDISLGLLREAAETKQARTKFTLRVLPVEASCYASAETIAQEAAPLLRRAFSSDPGTAPLKYAVAIDARANNGFNKMETIKAVAALVPEPHKVDLENPDVTILLEVVKTTCCIAVLPSYKELAKFNLRQVTEQQKDAATQEQAS